MTRTQTDKIREVLDPDYLIDTIQENFEPAEVFTDEQLEAWAEANGYKKSEG